MKKFLKIFSYIMISSVSVLYAFQNSDNEIGNSGFEKTGYQHWLFKGHCNTSSEVSDSGKNSVKISRVNSDVDSFK